ncbi:MAG: hypothetical protein LIP05_06150 [Tannerellaceae bacterium]|nr:hypothetical protein [Tannerellaceae bacterium]
MGVTVLEKGTQNGTVTDMDGNYTLEVQIMQPWYSLLLDIMHRKFR